jgi:small subunit ribosomal protein S1
MAEWRKEQKDRIIDDLQEGEIKDGKVSSITDFGVFVDLGGADGLAHMTELTWERGKKPRDLYAIGDTVQAYILKVDREAKKISLSLKRAQPEQWDDTVDRYVIGQILIGRVTKIMAFGAFVRLEGPVEGLIHISELSNRRIQTPKDVVKEGDVVPVKLVRIEKDRHRLGLSLRQARNDAEAMGFAFDNEGRVVDYPDDIREEYELPARSEDQVRQQQPRNASEAIEQAVARDPEPVSAMAHAFAQAFENAGDAPVDEGVPVAAVDSPAEAPADDAVEPDASIPAEEVVAEAPAAPEAEAEAPADDALEPDVSVPAEEVVAEAVAAPEAETEAPPEEAEEPNASAPAEVVAEAPAAPEAETEAPAEEATATEDSVPETENKVVAGDTPDPAEEQTTKDADVETTGATGDEPPDDA